MADLVDEAAPPSFLGTTELILIVVLMGVFVALAQTMESKGERWFRVVISLPLLVVAIKPTIFAGFFIAALAFLWAGRITHLLSGPLTRGIYGRGSQSAGHIPDFKYARSKAEGGEFKEAIKLTQWELTKNPNNYEGLMLLAAIYQELKQPAKGLKPLELILRNPEAPDAQKNNARQAQQQLREQQIRLDEERRRA